MVNNPRASERGLVAKLDHERFFPLSEWCWPVFFFPFAFLLRTDMLATAKTGAVLLCYTVSSAVS